jgi:hypothetical protein
MYRQSNAVFFAETKTMKINHKTQRHRETEMQGAGKGARKHGGTSEFVSPPRYFSYGDAMLLV